jgi:hypothetical protein
VSFEIRVLQQLQDISEKVSALMSQQDEINSDVTAIEAAVTALGTEIAALKAANPALDLTGLSAAVSSLTALAAPPAAPGS